jgi:hypothetical protein
MEKEFVPYELALRMKQLGFDEPCIAWYVSKSYGLEYGKVIKPDLIKEAVLAPTFSQAFRWFREKYGLYSWIQLHNGYINDSFYPELPIIFSIMDRKTGNKYYERDIPHNYLYKINEEAELACLEKLLEIVEQKEKYDNN